MSLVRKSDESGRILLPVLCFCSRASKTHHLVKLRSRDKPAECEMDPSDVNGETGVTRGIDASPEQLASLRAMLDSGELAPGDSVLVHGPGAEFDDENIFLLTDLSVTTSLRGRKLYREGRRCKWTSRYFFRCFRWPFFK